MCNLGKSDTGLGKCRVDLKLNWVSLESEKILKRVLFFLKNSRFRCLGEWRPFLLGEVRWRVLGSYGPVCHRVHETHLRGAHQRYKGETEDRRTQLVV